MADILDFTKPHVLRNEEEYDIAVAEIDTLLDTDPQLGSEAYERLEFLSVLVRLMKTRICRSMSNLHPRKWLILCWSRRDFAGMIWQSGWAVVARQQNFLKDPGRFLSNKLAHCERIWVFQRIC